jgi:dimethylamine/trimethylamine dehydrogenase
LARLGVEMVTAHRVTAFDGAAATLVDEYSDHAQVLAASSLVIVGHRVPQDALYRDLLATEAGRTGALPFTLQRIGDCDAPALIAAAVYAGHRYARELDDPVDPDLPMRHDRVDVGLVAPARWAPPPGLRDRAS